MTLEEKAKIALEYFRKTGVICTGVKFIGNWRGADVFQDTTPENVEKFMVGRAYEVLVSNTGNITAAGIESILEPDFP